MPVISKRTTYFLILVFSINNYFLAPIPCDCLNTHIATLTKPVAQVIKYYIHNIIIYYNIYNNIHYNSNINSKTGRQALGVSNLAMWISFCEAF